MALQGRLHWHILYPSIYAKRHYVHPAHGALELHNQEGADHLQFVVTGINGSRVSATRAASELPERS